MAVKISFFICFVIAVLLVCRYKEKPKGVFLYDNYIDIDRYTISRWHFSKMNYNISIKDVECCEIQKDNASNFGIRYYDTMGGVDDSFVMIRTNDNKTFCFCLENQEEFVETVTTRANEYRRKNGLEEI